MNVSYAFKCVGACLQTPQLLNLFCAADMMNDSSNPVSYQEDVAVTLLSDQMQHFHQ